MELTEKYANEPVILMEVVQDIESAEMLTEWLGGLDYLAARSEPMDQLMVDYEKTEFMPPMCVFVLVDLRSMTVYEDNCGQCHDLMAESCVDPFLEELNS